MPALDFPRAHRHTFECLPETFKCLPETFECLPETFGCLPETFECLPETFTCMLETAHMHSINCRQVPSYSSTSSPDSSEPSSSSPLEELIGLMRSERWIRRKVRKSVMHAFVSRTFWPAIDFAFGL